jgi:hypothetical protein
MKLLVVDHYFSQDIEAMRAAKYASARAQWVVQVRRLSHELYTL